MKKAAFIALNILLLFLSVIILIFPAIKNGYPLLFTDSGTYLSVGHTLFVPVDRPIVYGLFVRFTAFFDSVWMVIAAQAILFIYLLRSVIQTIVKMSSTNLNILTLGFCLILSLLTGLDYYVSIVLADIFSIYTLFCLYLLIALPKERWLDLIFVSLILAISLTVHLSHVPLAMGVMILVCLFLLLRKEFSNHIRRILYVAGFSGLSILLLAVLNSSLGFDFTLSRTNNIIAATRYIESGIANNYLKGVCNDPKFEASYKELCDYTDQFHRWPAAGIYLYSFDSPIYLGDCDEPGWDYCWLEKNDEYGDLIHDILSSERHRNQYLKLIFTGFFEQLITFEHTHLIPLSDFEYLFETYYKGDVQMLRESDQYAGTIHFKGQSKIEYYVVLISLLGVLVLLILMRKTISKKLVLFIVIAFSGLIVNAVICSALSNVIGRYQGRIIFIIPILFLLLLLEYLHQHKNRVV